MSLKNKTFIALLFVFVLVFSACANGGDTVKTTREPNRIVEVLGKSKPTDTPLVGQPMSDNSKEKQTISLKDIPTYSGISYVEVNNNIPFFRKEEFVTYAFEKYTSLDSKGRCGVAYANISQSEMTPTSKP